jgi:hypothetical protein
MTNKIVDQFQSQSLLQVFAELDYLRAEVAQLKNELEDERTDAKSCQVDVDNTSDCIVLQSRSTPENPHVIEYRFSDRPNEVFTGLELLLIHRGFSFEQIVRAIAASKEFYEHTK